ncbi:MAG: ATP-dependent Clp protease ATP-binding subunit [Deferribacteraceae bacterium]|jgi:ATP-dependent Clp protease ATP-binding subunit ClpC|nr:ATP-dependent Clp protease ATP-binding subunit [Deferribacteraceae bacterium]
MNYSSNSSNHLTDKARRVLTYSREEAERTGQPWVETEHILYGLLREKTGIAYEIFASRRTNISGLLKDIRSLSTVNDIPYSKSVDTPFSLVSRKVLEYTIEEARSLGQNSVSTEHILLGLMRERRGKAFAILTKLGFDYTDLREEITVLHRSGRYSAGATPMLDEFGKDLTFAASKGKIDPIIGRDKEVERLVRILSRRTKNNAVLIGEPGVGKTAVVEGLALRITSEGVPDALKRKRLVSVELGGIVAGTKYRGQFEERMKTMIKEIETAKNIIVFIDEFHTIVGAGAGEGAIDASNMLKPALARGAFQCIGTTTLAEYRKYIERDGALERRFQTILVEQPSRDDTIQILQGIRGNYERFHHVLIPDNVIDETVDLTNRYITDKFQPDKSIDVIDEACAKVKLQQPLADNSNFSIDEEHPYSCNFAFGGETAEPSGRKVAVCEVDEAEIPSLTVEDIEEVVSSISKVPVSRMKQTERSKLLALEKDLSKFVIGQDEAVDRVSKVMRRSFAGLNNPMRPLGSFIFLGPTGVGKTEVAKRLAEAVFGTQEALIRIDMSEFGEKFNISRLIGAPPGYVGYEQGGKLTEQVRNKPYSVVLFDEMEKAHPDVLNILLQIMDEGFVTDSLGHKVNFKNTIIILTSNLGTKDAAGVKNMGFGDKSGAEHAKERMNSAAQKALKQHFTPEFINRVDNIVYFNPLGMEELKKILNMQVDELNERLQKQDKFITVTEEAKEYILTKDYDFQYGARPIRRAVEHLIEDPLSEKILSGVFGKRKKLRLLVKEGSLAIE